MPVEILQLVPLLKGGDEELHRMWSACRFYELSDPEPWLAEHGRSIRAVVTAGYLGVTNDLIDRLPALEFIAIAGAGYDRIDLDFARRRGIRITNTPDILSEDVADFAIGLMIAAMRRLPAADRHVREGHWKLSEMPLATRVSGRRYGIFGLGRIGRAVARRLEGFGGAIAYCSRSPKLVPYPYFSSILALAAASDVLLLTASASSTTHHIVDREVLEALGPHGALINVARGSLVNEMSLIDALKRGALGSAGLDVFADEPCVRPELLELDAIALAPHAASATREARVAMTQCMLDNLKAFFSGVSLPNPVG